MTAITLPHSNTDHTWESFKNRFPNETSSVLFLFSKRWPEGFECPYCNWHSLDLVPSRTITCGHCGHPTSITTNTIMHGTKKSISEWLFCIWWLSSNSAGSSAKDLQRLLQISSYQTAWTWLQKLRMAMAAADSKKCFGTVELSCKHISLGGSPPSQPSILCAAEITFPGGITGRIKMEVLTPGEHKDIRSFVEQKISSLSSLTIGNEEILDAIKQAQLPHTAVVYPMVYKTKEIIKSFEIWLNKIHRGGVAVKHLQLYLDEFCFRRNAEMLPDREAVFNSLLEGVVNTKSPSYRSIISKTAKE